MSHTRSSFVSPKFKLMKNFTLVIIIAAFAFISCSKENLNDVIVYPNLIAAGNFEDLSSAYDQWSTEGTGSLLGDEADAYEGKYSMQIHTFSCINMKYIDSIPVFGNNTYELSFALKMDGITTGCATEFVVSIQQGENELLYFNIDPSSVTDWTIKKFYITTINNTPLTMEMVVGMDGIHVDDIQLKILAD